MRLLLSIIVLCWIGFPNSQCMHEASISYASCSKLVDVCHPLAWSHRDPEFFQTLGPITDCKKAVTSTGNLKEEPRQITSQPLDKKPFETFIWHSISAGIMEDHTHLQIQPLARHAIHLISLFEFCSGNPVSLARREKFPVNSVKSAFKRDQMLPAVNSALVALEKKTLSMKERIYAIGTLHAVQIWFQQMDLVPVRTDVNRRLCRGELEYSLTKGK